MGHCHKEIYLHLVWATKGRDPLLIPTVERRIHRCVQSEAERLHAVVLAVGGLADHVHLVVQVPPHVSAMELVKQVKGVSSRFAAAELVAREGLLPYFSWQEGYSVFSLSRSHLADVVPYVRNQKQRHAEQNTWEAWEEMDDQVIKIPRNKFRG